MSESYMERALSKLARQLSAYDEASLMGLWEKYAEQVRDFEPSKRWEESVLILNFIQSVRFKNQLFNYRLAEGRKPEQDQEISLAALTAPEPAKPEPELDVTEESDMPKEAAPRKAKVLKLTPKTEVD